MQVSARVGLPSTELTLGLWGRGARRVALSSLQEPGAFAGRRVATSPGDESPLLLRPRLPEDEWLRRESVLLRNLKVGLSVEGSEGPAREATQDDEEAEAPSVRWPAHTRPNLVGAVRSLSGARQTESKPPQRCSERVHTLVASRRAQTLEELAGNSLRGIWSSLPGIRSSQLRSGSNAVWAGFVCPKAILMFERC